MRRESVVVFLSHALILGAVILLGSAAFATATLRGQLVRIDSPHGVRVPAGGITVTVSNPAIGRSEPVTTDADGMYYLHLPPGRYRLEVWTTNAPEIFEIQVNEPYTDIPPIVVH